MMPQDNDLHLAGLHGLPGMFVKFLGDGLGDPSGPLRTGVRGRRVYGGAAPRRRRSLRRRVTGGKAGSRLPLAPRRAGRSSTERTGTLVLVFFDDEQHFADDDLELARNLAGAARGALERERVFGERSAVRARSRSIWPARGRCSQPSSIRPRCSTRSCAMLRRARGRRGGHPTARGRRARGERGGGRRRRGLARLPRPTTAQLQETWSGTGSPRGGGRRAGQLLRLTQSDPILTAGYARTVGVRSCGPRRHPGRALGLFQVAEALARGGGAGARGLRG